MEGGGAGGWVEGGRLAFGFGMMRADGFGCGRLGPRVLNMICCYAVHVD